MKFTFLLTFSLVVFALQAQTAKIDYEAKYDFVWITDTVNNEFAVQGVDYLLLHSRGESRFLSSNRNFNDSMIVEYEKEHPELLNIGAAEEMQRAVNLYIASFKNWKKGTSNDYFYLRKDFSEKLFQAKLYNAIPVQHLEDELTLTWEMGTESDTIMGLLCYLATTDYGGRKYQAWFAPSIPIPDGPYVFSGLPGLIVKVSDTQGWFTFTLKTIETKVGKRFWKKDYLPPASRAIDRKAYVDFSRKQKDNPRLMGAIDVDEEILLDMKERYLRKNYMLLETY